MEGAVVTRSRYTTRSKPRPEWGRIRPHPAALHFETDVLDVLRSSPSATIAPHSSRQGPNAPGGSKIRASACRAGDRWSYLPDGRGLIARLGRRVLVKRSQGRHGGAWDNLEPGARGPTPSAPGRGLRLTGSAGEVMLQVCGVNFGSLDLMPPGRLTRVAVIRRCAAAVE